MRLYEGGEKMADIMEFPEYWEDFIKEYSFKDNHQIYTNGSELVPVSRVKQMVDYYFSTGLKAVEQAIAKEFREKETKNKGDIE